MAVTGVVGTMMVEAATDEDRPPTSLRGMPSLAPTCMQVWILSKPPARAGRKAQWV